MTLHVGLAVNTISADAVDVRLAMAGLIIRDGNGLPRSGLFPNRSVSAVVTARTDMSIDVGLFNAVVASSAIVGPVLFGNDGTVTVGPLAAAPASNSRYDLVYVQHGLTTAPVFGVVTGTASATPAIPSTPANSIALATVLIPSTATTTSSSGVAINEVFPYTGVVGSPIWMRSAADRDASGFGFGQQVRRLDLGNWVEENMAARASAGTPDPGRVSGWYPIYGNLPRVDFSNGGTAQGIGNNTTWGLQATQSVESGGFIRAAGSGAVSGTSVSRWRLPYAGRYAATVSGTWDTPNVVGSTGLRQIYFVSSGAAGTFASSRYVANNDAPPMAVTGIFSGAAGDYIEPRLFLVRSDSTTAGLNFTLTGGGLTYLGPI